MAIPVPPEVDWMEVLERRGVTSIRREGRTSRDTAATMKVMAAVIIR
jgi:hypothetical protein